MKRKLTTWVIIGILAVGFMPVQSSIAATYGAMGIVPDAGSELISTAEAITEAAPQENDLTVAVDTREIDLKDPDLSKEYFVVQYDDGTIETRKLEESAGILSMDNTEAAATLEEQMELYENKPSVEIVEPLLVRYINDQSISYTYNDTYWAGDLWGIKQVDADDLHDWDYEEPLSDVIVAVIDTGVDMNQEDLTGAAVTVIASGSAVHGYNAIDQNFNYADDNGHGTHVAGTIGATGDNGTGVVGVASGVRILPVKVMNATGSGLTSDIADGIRWAVDHGADVINLSIGSSTSSAIESAAVDYAYNNGVIVVGAAGNESNNWTSGEADLWDVGDPATQAAIDYPAAYSHAIAVGSVGKRLNGSVTLSDFSNSGNALDVVAPGEFIMSTSMGGLYRTMSGTSMATPHVAGIAALLKAQFPSETADQIMNRITESAIQVTAGTDAAYGGNPLYYGSGVVNAYRSVALDNALLSGIALDGVAMTGFSPGTTSYSFQYENSATPPAVTATPASVVAACSINRSPASGYDANHQAIVTIHVTAVDGITTRDYTIKFTDITTTSSGGVTTYDLTGMTSSQAITIDGDTVDAFQVGVSTVGGVVVSASLPAINLETTAGALNITVEIPAGTVVTGPSGWDGVLNLPTYVTTPAFNTGGTLSYALEVGSATESLTFSKAVRILFPGQGGKRVGYGIGSGFTEITTTLGSDSQSAGDGLSAGSAGKITAGSNLIVWTKHFTTFATYTVAAVVPAAGGGGGGGGGGLPIEEEVTAPAITTAAINLEFSDISGHWAKDAITTLVSMGAITGYPDGTFQPDAHITRAEFVAILVKAQGRTGSQATGFTDLDGHWAKGVIETANYNGIISNQDGGTFRPDDPITREEMAAMIDRGMAYISQLESVDFTDKDAISPWASKAVRNLYLHGIISGYPDGTFRPKGQATRAEAVTMLLKTIQ